MTPFGNISGYKSKNTLYIDHLLKKKKKAFLDIHILEYNIHKDKMVSEHPLG